MEALLRRGIGPLFTQVRFKFHSKRPRPRHLSRRLLEKIMIPIYPEELKFDVSKVCTVSRMEKEENEKNKKILGENKFEDFLVREALKVLDDNKMLIAVDVDKTIMRRFLEMRSLMLDSDIDTVVLPGDVFRKALLQTKYSNFAQVIGTHTYLLVSKEDKVKPLLKTLRKTPEMHLLGGIVSNGMFTKQGLEDFIKLPDLDSQRSHLVSTLGLQSSRTLSLLQHNQRLLISRLARIGLKDEEKKE